MTNKTILRVYRTKKEAKTSYDRISGFYDYFAGLFERKFRDKALEQLNFKKGETVLEIGFGTGHCLEDVTKRVGKNGKVYGIDISQRMLDITRKRLKKGGLGAELYCGDAIIMPYKDNMFDAVFMSFALELFDTPEIPTVLKEIKRVLKPKGRLGVASMLKEDGESRLLKLYEWAHKKFPKYVDCRPIYVEQSIKDAGYSIKGKEKVKLFGLPVEIVVAKL